MAQKRYFPDKESKQLIWVENFAAKAIRYAEKYGYTETEAKAVALVYDDFLYRVNSVSKVAASARQWTAYKNALVDGLPAGAIVQLPEAPSLVSNPAETEPGGLLRVLALARRIKAHPAYSIADGNDLQLEGADDTTDYLNLYPEASIRAGNAGQPEIVWKKGTMDGITIYKDSGAGFQRFDTDNFPNYTDKSPLPAPGSSAVWKYKLIYRRNDEETGQWSPVLTITVGQ